MAGLKNVKGFKEPVINICHDDTDGQVVEIDGLFIQLPKQIEKSRILFRNLPQKDQKWNRLEVPRELEKIRSMDEWNQQPKEFKEKYSPYIKQEFERRRNGVWFYNNGEPTYITGDHYMLLQWSQMDIG